MEFVMKKSHLLFAAAVIALSSSAFAGTNTNYPWTEPKLESSKTRMEVRAELEQAYKEGTLARGADYSYPAMPAKGVQRMSNDAQQAPRQAARFNTADFFMYGA
jgi:hypothetical protein